MSAAGLPLDPALPPGEPFNRLAVDKGWYARCDAALGFARKELPGLNGLWRAKAKDGIPRWRDFSLRDLAPHMPNVALFEAVADADTLRFRIRLLGTSLIRIYGQAGGKFIDGHFSPAVAEVWHASLGETLRSRVPLRYTGRVSYERNDFFTVESIQMPLSENGNDADRVLMVMHLLEGPAKA